MDPENARASASARQTEIYGESWAVRLRRLMDAYGVSQARLAAVIGLSAPMLSQLISGQRVKISNPAVYGRIVGLEEALADPAFATRQPEQIADLLDRTAASQPVLSTRVAAGAVESTAGPALADALAALAGPGALTAAADAVRRTAPALAAVLDAAARTAGGRPAT